jgi:hypothetical protein
MNIREDSSGDDKRWRKLCELVATEADPQRLSKLLDQLLKELDARREALRAREQESGSTPVDI